MRQVPSLRHLRQVSQRAAGLIAGVSASGVGHLEQPPAPQPGEGAPLSRSAPAAGVSRAGQARFPGSSTTSTRQAKVQGPVLPIESLALPLENLKKLSLASVKQSVKGFENQAVGPFAEAYMPIY